MQNGLFTDRELEDMGTLTLDMVQRAIDGGDYERAKGLTRRMHKEFLAMHDFYLAWVTATLSFVGRRFGDRALSETLQEGCGAWLEPLMELYAEADPRKTVEMLAAGFRGHLTGMRIDEDDEKITMLFQPCPSGGRLILDRSYDPPRNFLRVKEAQPMTYGREDFPVYCAHCSFQETLPIDRIGAPIWVVDPSNDLGKEPCRVYVYKRREDIPARFYERLGRQKPKHP